MEQKLYYQDAYLQTFSAKVLKQDQDESGNWFVVLDKTAFYPTGGGQPHDIGTLNDIKVLNVEEIEGEIRHYLERPLAEISDEVLGFIDWKRRFDHMQQHAGQHILSAAFEELFNYETISFHLGKEMLTIDLNTAELKEEQAELVEQYANQIILENQPIETKWVTGAELSQYKLRKQISITEDIRLVIIPDFDYNGCGGTHPNSTGQVGSLKILDWERQKKKIRVQFVCGNRVLTQLGQKQKILKRLSPLVNAPEMQMVAAVTKMLETAKEVDKGLEEARESLLQYEAKELLQNVSMVDGNRIISKVFQNRSIQELQKFGRFVASETADGIVILVSENEARLQLVCARGLQASTNMKTIVSELLPVINGKGGGNDSFAQGGGDSTISGEQLLEKAIALLVKGK